MEMRTEQGRELFELGLRLGTLGTVTIGAGGGGLALLLARCVGCGVALAGGEARFHDGSCAACGVWLADYYGMSAAVFIRQDGNRAYAMVLNGKGRPLTSFAGGFTGPCAGQWDLLAGADAGWAAGRASDCGRAETVAVRGPAALRLLLERMGCDVLDRPCPSIPLLCSDPEGFRLSVERDGMSFILPGKDALAAAADWLACGKAIPAFRTELM